MFSKKMNRKALGPRLIFWSTFTLTVSLLIVSSTIYYLLSSSLKTKDQEYIARTAISIAEAIKSRNIEAINDFKSPEILLMIDDQSGKNIYLSMPDYLDQDIEDDFELAHIKTEALQLSHQEGWHTILLDSDEKDTDIYHRFEYWLRIKANENKWTNILPLIDNDMFEIYSLPLPNGYWLKVGKSFEKTDEYLAAVRRTTLIVLLPFILFGYVLSYFLARTTLAPIKKLAKTITRIRKGESDLRGEIKGTGDEIDVLAEEFNSLLDQNEKLVKNLKSTIDNVAHDLRTPVTRFRTSLEYALLREANIGDLKESLQEGLEGSERILELLNAIMDVSESESQTMKIKLEKIELDNFFELLNDLYMYACEDKNITLEISSAENLCITADRVRLTQAMGNLIDNSLKYSPENTKIKILAESSGNDIRITITDEGMGIPEEDLEKIWDRLYRGDKSRTSPGLGIGLSVVNAIIKAHNGSISVTSSTGLGTTFSLTLPSCND